MKAADPAAAVELAAYGMLIAFLLGAILTTIFWSAYQRWLDKHPETVTDNRDTDSDGLETLITFWCEAFGDYPPGDIRINDE